MMTFSEKEAESWVRLTMKSSARYPIGETAIRSDTGAPVFLVNPRIQDVQDVFDNLRM